MDTDTVEPAGLSGLAAIRAAAQLAQQQGEAAQEQLSARYSKMEVRADEPQPVPHATAAEEAANSAEEPTAAQHPVLAPGPAPGPEGLLGGEEDDEETTPAPEDSPSSPSVECTPGPSCLMEQEVAADSHFSAHAPAADVTPVEDPAAPAAELEQATACLPSGQYYIERALAEHAVASDLLSAFKSSATDLLSNVPGAVEQAAVMAAQADALTMAAVETAQRVGLALETAVQSGCGGLRRGASSGGTTLGESVAGALSVAGADEAYSALQTAGDALLSEEVRLAATSASALAYNLVHCAPEDQAPEM